jgi:DNA polymerase elongation subunit (family B)
MNTLYDDGKNIHPSWLSPFDVTSNARNENRKIPGRAPFDMLESFCDKLTFSNWRSRSLEYVANEEIGVGKIDDVNINEDWKNNPSRLISYNIVDVILTVALDDVNDIHNFFYEMADIASIPIYDVFYEKRIVDGYVMSHRDDDEILPTADKSELVENAGGYVAEPIQGRKQNVGVSDLKSLYPSVIITWNLSTETVSETPEDFDNYVKIPKVPEPKNVSGKITENMMDWEWLYASLDQEGIIPRVSKKLFKKRNFEKKQMYDAVDGSQEEKKWERKQGATKVIMNSIYGNLSSKYYRLSNEYLGDSVTSTARYTLWKGEKTIERLDYDHIYSDTDSHFIQLTGNDLKSQTEELKNISSEMDSDASEIAQEIGIDDKHPFLIGEDLHGDDYTCLLWEPEKIYNNFMQLGNKKRYAGNIRWKEGTVYDDVKISISGFENQRSDSMLVTADLQEDIIEMVLTDATFRDVSEYIQDIISQIDREHEEVRKFALPGSINKDLEDYPNRQVPRACMWSNEHLEYEFGEGDDPFVYLVSDTPVDLPQTDVVAFEWNEEIPGGFELDKEEIIERGIRKPIEPIIQEMGWEWKEVRSGAKTQTIDLSTSGNNPYS